MSDRPRNISHDRRRRRSALVFVLRVLVALATLAALGYVTGRYVGDVLL